MARVIFSLILAMLLGCGLSRQFNLAATPNYLYVASGSCYAGGPTVSTGPANTLSKYSLVDGTFAGTLLDYNQQSPGDSPISIRDYDVDNLLVLIENTSGRRIDLVRKDGSGFSTYLLNSTALSAVMRSMALLPDFSLLVSKTTAVEKFTAAKARVLAGASPYISAPAAPCSVTNTMISSVTADPVSKKIVYAHAAATPNNKVVVINSTGYTVAGDCNSGTAGPTTTALPTQVLFHPNGKLLVTYGSTTLSSNFIYSYDFNGTTGALSNPVAVFNDGGTLINGPSAIAADPVSNDVFVSNATSSYNTIERFTFADNVLTQIPSGTFVTPSIYTRCIADMVVTN